MRESPMIIALNKEKTVYDGFITVLEVALKSQPGCQSFSPPQYYSQLITEMEILGWDNLKSGTVADPDWFRKGEVPQNLVILMSFSCLEEATFTVNYCIDGVRLLFIDAEFRTLKMKAEDSAGRQHAITIKLKSKYPAEAPEFSADLPVPLVITWTSQSTLASVHSQFLINVEALSEFWSVLDEIDEQTWVLEPEKPTKADSMRRIAIGNNVSIKVQIDPRHPKMLPECCLLGAEHVVTPLRNKLNANMHLWNPDCSVLQNMKDVLEIEFPSPTTHEKSSFSVECGICYSYRLESDIPDQVCNDPRCGQPFHQVCLYEWLRGLPTSRQSFNIVFGECPYCSKSPLIFQSTNITSPVVSIIIISFLPLVLMPAVFPGVVPPVVDFTAGYCIVII
ncbi:E3 ubiquitin-protein ligase FANCL [Anabarilius grahami]|uniref:E3 ubiquitin-protein ligase FANCL n=1 Tax=Anabarilius grahami TaxID=495550 RepID=A0A3N0YUJ1_ANAGA|nr:E3 ubiquitin-protein ligase FANCL [Anabarilius grahami]